MNQLPHTVLKLIDYALCPSAGREEASTAINAALPMIRAAGVTNTGQLAAAIGLPAVITADQPDEAAGFPMGKYAGQYVAHIWDIDRGYCKWFRDAVEVDGKYADDIAACHDEIDALAAAVRKRGSR